MQGKQVGLPLHQTTMYHNTPAKVGHGCGISAARQSLDASATTVFAQSFPKIPQRRHAQGMLSSGSLSASRTPLCCCQLLSSTSPKASGATLQEIEMSSPFSNNAASKFRTTHSGFDHSSPLRKFVSKGVAKCS